MFHLAQWLTRHINDPKLILWLAERGDQLHDSWSRLIEKELDHITRLELEGKTSELDEIRSNAPNAIPDPLMRKLWRLLLTDRVKSPWRDLDLHRWILRFKREGLSSPIRLELRKLLEPKIKLKKPFHWDGFDESTETPQRLKQLVDWELVLASDHVHSSLRDLKGDDWAKLLPGLLNDFQQLLRDALDLLQELGGADDRYDRSCWDLPSISSHPQNKGFHDWVMLIELLRDAWVALLEVDSESASRIAGEWFNLHYPTFKRLALFAASQGDCISPDKWVGWLSDDEAWWLWSIYMRRETMRLLVLQGDKLSPSAREILEAAVLAGPPRTMFKEDNDPEQSQAYIDHLAWLLLSKLKIGSGNLGADATKRLDELSAAYPQWKLADNERDEFSHWMSGTGDPDYEAGRQIDIAPRFRRELVKWLKESQPKKHPFYEDTWRITCQTRFFHCLYALCDLAQEGIWIAERWGDALYAWSEKSQILRSWRYAAPLVQSMPTDIFQEILHSVTWWVKAASNSIEINEHVFMDICNRALTMQYQDDTEPHDPVTSAINHPVGYVAEALLNLWFKRQPNDNDGLPADIEPMFTQLCNTTIKHFRHGRVLLASRIIALFRVDRVWSGKTYFAVVKLGNRCGRSQSGMGRLSLVSSPVSTPNDCLQVPLPVDIPPLCRLRRP